MYYAINNGCHVDIQKYLKKISQIKIDFLHKNVLKFVFTIIIIVHHRKFKFTRYTESI